jgi:FeS assembly SUF system regulator
MRLSNLADYAVVIMSAAARAGDGARLSATVLAEGTGIPLPTTQKLLGKLAGAGLFRSARGGGGGFVLTRAPGQISLADVVEAVEGPIAMTSCVDEGRHDCALEGACLVRPHWGPVNTAIRKALSNVSLESLASPSLVRPERSRGTLPSEAEAILANARRGVSTVLDTSGFEVRSSI